MRIIRIRYTTNSISRPTSWNQVIHLCIASVFSSKQTSRLKQLSLLQNSNVKCSLCLALNFADCVDFFILIQSVFFSINQKLLLKFIRYFKRPEPGFIRTMWTLRTNFEWNDKFWKQINSTCLQNCNDSRFIWDSMQVSHKQISTWANWCWKFK